MPREEKISVSLVKSSAYSSTISSMKKDAEQLKQAFGSIKVGNIAKVEKENSAAAKEASNAIIAQAKAEKELANAETARQKAAQASIDATTKQIKAQKEAANAVSAEQNAAKKTIQTKQAALRLTQQEAAAVEKNARVYRQLGESLNKVSADQAKSLSGMTQYIRNIQGLENATVKATGVVRNSAGTFQTYTATVNNADGTTQKFKFSVETTEGQVYKLDQGLRSASSGAASFTSSFSKAASSLIRTLKTLVGFYGVAQSLRYAFTEMKSMSDEMIVYQKVTKATATEMERLRDASYDVAKRYGQTPTDFLSAAQEMARAGYKDQSAAMAELAIKTKLVGDITAEQASKFLLAVDAGYKYGGSIEKLSLVLDMANEVGNNYATSIDKISEGMTLVASLAAQANIPIEQLIAALGTMTATTQRSGSEMARALRFTILGILGDTTTEVEEGITVSADEVNSITTALQHYAPEVVNAAKATGELINPMEAIGALAKAYREGLIKSKDELFQISKAIAGQRYYNAFAALIENWDTMYQGMLDKEKEALGSADAEINVLMQGWTQKFNKLKTTWTEVVNKSVQEGFIKDLIDGATSALEFAGSLENLAMMAGGAITAIKLLSSTVKQYSAINKAVRAGETVALSTRASAAVTGVASIAGIAISIIGAIKAAKEAAIQAAFDAAQKQLSDTQKEFDKYKQLMQISKRYNEIWSDGFVTESEKSELVTMQNELNTLLGKQAEAIDIVNGKYGDMKIAIDKAVASQTELTEADIQRMKNSVLLAFLKSYGEDLGLVSYGKWGKEEQQFLSENIPGFDRFFGFTDNGAMFNYQRWDSNYSINTVEDMIDYYNTVNTLLKLFDLTEGFATDNPNIYTWFLNQKNTMDNAGVSGLMTIIESYNQLTNATSEGAEASKDAAKAASDSGKAMDDEAKAADRLAQSIHDATEAKKKFDDAMKSTKAGAMGDYATAYSTLETEIKEGRVNSTAFYASARMIMGEDMFKATGGTSQNVMAMLNNRGASGSLREAMDILNAVYKDKEGNVIEGFGIYQLLSQTKGVDQSSLVTADGRMMIPNFTQDQLNAISREWGGLSTDLMLAWFNALDQYDIWGTQTEDVKNALAGAEEQAAEGMNAVAESANAAANALDAVAEAAGGESSGVGEGEKPQSASSSKSERMYAVKDAEGEYSGSIAKAEHLADTRADEAIEYAREKAWRDEQMAEAKENAAKRAEELEQQYQAMLEAGKSRPWNEIRRENVRQIFGVTDDESLIAVVQKIMADSYKYRMDMQSATGQPYDATLALTAMLDGYGATMGSWDVLTEMYKEAVARQYQRAQGKATQTLEDTVGTGLFGDDGEEDVSIGGAPSAFYEAGEQAAQSIADGIEENKGVIEEAVANAATEAARQMPDAIGTGAFSDDGEEDVSIGVGANTDKAEAKVEQFVESVPKVVTIEIRTKGTHLTSPSSGGLFHSVLDALLPFHVYDSGTTFHPGGPALVNDGRGPELIAQRGGAFIAAGGQPAIVNLERGAKVFTAEQTSSILGGIPAYAGGTTANVSDAIASMFDWLLGDVTRQETGDESRQDQSNGRNNSGPKVDKESYAKLQTLMNYILNRLDMARQEQEEQDRLEELRKNLADAQNERTVRYLGEDGKWHWMADANKVEKARKDLEDYQKDQEYNNIVKTWQQIQEAVETPTGDIDKLLSNILKNGTAPQKKAAEYIQSLLIGNLLQGGSYSGNYAEALTAIQAANEGSPFMPTELSYTLSSLIANTGAHESVGAVTESLMQTASGTVVNGATRGTVYGSPTTNYNYYINGVELGSDQANRPLSDILNDLTVYTNSTVH